MMSKIDIEIIAFVEKVRRRLFAIKAINYSLIALSGALAVGILFAMLSRFIPIYDVYMKSLYMIIPALCLGIIYAFFRLPDRKKAALTADSKGLKERTVTALELIGDNRDIAALQKQDTLIHIRNFDLKKLVPMRVNHKYLVVVLILTASLSLSAFLPNSMKEKAEDMHKQKVKIAETQKKIDKLVEKINKNPEFTLEQKKEINKKLAELKKDLKTTNNEKELNKTLQKWDKKIEIVKRAYGNEELDKIAEKLETNEMTKELAEQIKNRDIGSVKKDLSKLAKELETMTPSKLKELAEAYLKLAEEFKENPELKKAFSDLAKKVDAGELGNIQGELDAVAKALENLMYDPGLSDALGELSKELNDMQQGVLPGQNNQPGQGTQPGQNGQPGEGNEPGQGGSGAGEGTDKGQENQTPVKTQGGIGQKGESEGKTGEYERIFTPKTLGGEGQTSELGGKKGTGGNSDQVITDKSPTIEGEAVPYNQVIGEYKQNAIESINSSDIPEGMKELVKNYFGTLEE